MLSSSRCADRVTQGSRPYAHVPLTKNPWNPDDIMLMFLKIEIIQANHMSKGQQWLS